MEESQSTENPTEVVEEPQRPAPTPEQPHRLFTSRPQLLKPGYPPTVSWSVRTWNLVSCLPGGSLKSCPGFPGFSERCTGGLPWSGALTTPMSHPRLSILWKIPGSDERMI